MSNCFAFLWTCFRKWRNHSDGHYSGCPKYVTFSGRALHVTKEEVKSRNKYISWMIIDCVEHLKKWNAVWQLVSVTSSLWPMEMLLNYTNIFECVLWVCPHQQKRKQAARLLCKHWSSLHSTTVCRCPHMKQSTTYQAYFLCLHKDVLQPHFGLVWFGLVILLKHSLLLFYGDRLMKGNNWGNDIEII